MYSGLKSIIGAAVLALAALPAYADMQQHIGQLSGVVTLGQDGDWTAEDKGGWFTLTNTDAPGAIHYYWMEVPGLQASDYVVALNLVTQNDGGTKPSYGGLIFNYRAGDRYLGVTIGSDGAGYLFIRTPEGFKTRRAADVHARNDGSDILRAHVTGTKVRFEVNGATLASVDSPDGFSSKLGVMAIGKGQFGFTGFSIN